MIDVPDVIVAAVLETDELIERPIPNAFVVSPIDHRHANLPVTCRLANPSLRAAGAREQLRAGRERRHRAPLESPSVGVGATPGGFRGAAAAQPNEERRGQTSPVETRWRTFSG